MAETRREAVTVHGYPALLDHDPTNHALEVTWREPGGIELWLGATRAGLIQYRSQPGVVVLVHTEVDPAFAGQGLGERLVAGALADLRARGLKLVPLCRFVRAYLRRHPDQADLVAGDPAAPSDHGQAS